MFIQRHELLDNPMHCFTVDKKGSQTKCLLTEQNICNALQILQPQQQQTLFEDKALSLRLSCTGRNEYAFEIVPKNGQRDVTPIHANISNTGVHNITEFTGDNVCFLRFLAAQMIAEHEQGQKLVTRISKHDGVFEPKLVTAQPLQVSAQFRKDNATFVSHFKDMLAENGHIFTASTIEKLLLLTATTTACNSKHSDNMLLHISQNSCSHPPDTFFEHLATFTPHNQYMTILTRKGNSQNMPGCVMRSNLTVYMFPKNHEMTQQIQRLGMNTGRGIQSGVMIVRGHDNRAAAVYIDPHIKSPANINSFLRECL